jgi:hypothetical protein
VLFGQDFPVPNLPHKKIQQAHVVTLLQAAIASFEFAQDGNNSAVLRPSFVASAHIIKEFDKPINALRFVWRSSRCFCPKKNKHMPVVNWRAIKMNGDKL